MQVCAKCRSRYSRRAQFCGIDGSRIVETDTDPLIGTTLDRYRIATAIGEGAFGCVYRAVHTTLNAEFAVKVLFGDLGSDETFVARFRREAQAASRIRSAHVVSVIDFVTAPDGLSYLVMEYVNGVALDAVIRREGQLPPLRAARLAEGIASGLAAAHALGFVHRDVKPSNVLVVSEGGHDFAKLLDFGIVRQAAVERPPHQVLSAGGVDATQPQPDRLTREGRVMGTPAYMSPEQWTRPDVGPSADLYSLGVVLYEMLAGVKPFPGDDFDELWRKHFYAEPPPPPPSFGLEAIAARLMAKSPEDRPPSASAVRDELERIVARLSQPERYVPDPGATPVAHATPRANLEQRARHRDTLDQKHQLLPAPSRTRLVLGGVAGAALVAGVIGLLAASRPSRERPPMLPPPVPVLSAQLDEALALRGLTLDDLATLDPQRVERGRRAIASHDPNEVADLVAFAAAAPITAELIRGKLDRLDGPLSRAREFGGKRARELEEHYLELYKELKASVDSRKREGLVRKVASFERELRAPPISSVR